MALVEVIGSCTVIRLATATQYKKRNTVNMTVISVNFTLSDVTGYSF